ncbi:MAG: hypothetical protein LBB87_00945, partial [Nitrososphaerota archaeon]|nr:hypothetical protein [Nitrososphaerota archaeon]
MRYIKKFSTILLLVALIGFFAALPITYAATSKSNQEEALSFVTNVIPFDTTKYDITLTNHINDP